MQFEPVPGDIAANVSASVAMIDAAAREGARFILFPELSLVGYRLTPTPDWWVTDGDARLDPLREAITGAGVTAVVGAPHLSETGVRSLAAIWLRPGRPDLVQPKTHLHGAELELFTGGSAVTPIVEVDGWRVAVGVCYDAAVPAHAARAAEAGADLYAVSALYTTGQERRADLHLGARAMDHGMFAMLANLAGSGDDWVSCGGSGVWDPSGAPTARLGDGSGVLVTTLPAPGTFTDGPPAEPDREAAAALWARFRDAHPEAPAALPTVGPFGATSAHADQLLGLVLAGVKSATSTLLAEFGAEDEPLPRPGDHWIVTDAAGAPRAILRTVELRIGRFLSVDDAHAFDEGEDDRSRDSWIHEHRRYWQRRCAQLGLEWTDDAEILFERFTVVWPSNRKAPGRPGASRTVSTSVRHEGFEPPTF